MCPLALTVLLFTCRPVTGFVDRIEGPIAVVLEGDGRERTILRRCLPPAAREGTVVFRGRIDGAATRRAAREARDLLDHWRIPATSPTGRSPRSPP